MFASDKEVKNGKTQEAKHDKETKKEVSEDQQPKPLWETHEIYKYQ